MPDLFGDKCPCCGQPMPDKAMQSSSFSQFWETTNKRGSKPLAERAWAKLTTAEKEIAAAKVKPFYAWFANEYPGASAMHISTYLNGKHFMQEAVKDRKALSPGDHPGIAAVKSGKRHLCSGISAALARSWISQGFVTEADCKTVGIL